MYAQSIDPVSSSPSMASAAATVSARRATAPRPAAPHPAPPPAPAPAATTQMTQVPASVSAADRATYLQLLKASGGNVAAALAALQAMKAEAQS
jgi:hypothetical protein